MHLYYIIIHSQLHMMLGSLVLQEENHGCQFKDEREQKLKSTLAHYGRLTGI